MEEIGQSGVAAELGNEPRDVIAALPAACRALDPQNIEAVDQAAVPGSSSRLSSHGLPSRDFWEDLA
jgi:hypothetical protein